MTMFLRRPQHRYEDPLDRVWTLCAERIGFRVERTPAVYASTDGRGTILIGTPETLDADDSLAQMILHELCHALIEGAEGEAQPDWGLDNTSNRHRWREHACLRLQAYLTGSVGLRAFFAPTTDFRISFWESLPADPFAAPPESGGRREPSCVAARLGAWRASQPRWHPHLTAALNASAAIAGAVLLMGAKARHETPLPSLWTVVDPRPPGHPAGHAPVAAYLPGEACSGCAWSFVQRRGRRCRHVPSQRLPEDAPACVRFEPASELDCTQCGACCREAYHAVEVAPGEPILRRRPEWVVQSGSRYRLRRDGDRCAALTGGQTALEGYTCGLYAERPRTCRDFTRGSANCLDARRRVGLSL